MTMSHYAYAWKSILAQRTPVIIIIIIISFILNWLFIVEQKCEGALLNIISMLYENFSLFEHYGVDEYMTSFGLSVDKKFRGRGIGERILTAR